MAFIFSNTVREKIRTPDLFEPIPNFKLPAEKLIQQRQIYRQQREKRNRMPRELPNLAIHGITPNGTYFFCNLVYRKDLTEFKKITIFNLIDAYANTEEHAERVKLKAQIKEVCGEQVEGIALLFSNSSGTYGFVTGNRVKVAQLRDNPGVLELDADELFSYSKVDLSFECLVFILENEEGYTPELINQYIQDQSINTDVINAIKQIITRESPLEDMIRYLKTAYTAIQDPILQNQVKSVYDALQSCRNDDSEISYKVAVLTLQLLYCQDNEKRQQLLTDYTKLASTLYGSKIPTKMILGASIFFLGVSFLILPLLILPLHVVILESVSFMLGGLILGMKGKNEFYSDNAIQKRNTANTFFKLKESLNNISEDLIPRKISDPSDDSWALLTRAP